MKCPGGLWVTLLLAVGLTAAQSEGEYDPLLEILEEGRINFALQPVTVTDKFGEAFNRSTVTLGILPDEEWEGLNRRKIYRINDIMKVAQNGGTGFRSHCKGGKKKCAEARGSDKNVLIPPKPFPHKPHMDEVEGCGNPICVILDSKPRRFHSVCSLIKFLKSENRAHDYINYIQKGDCYDIIDNANPSIPDEGGATNKKWINMAPKNCNRCKQDKHCSEKVIFVIDILNVLEGKSSAPGGPVFSETRHGSNKKHGLPFEFSNICEAMKLFAASDNINLKTQVMGFGLGNVNEIFSTQSGEKCLWTEWFDLDTPCDSDGEKESHSKHYERLMTSYTGPMRICRQKQVTLSTHKGGSEWTQVISADAEAGKAMGNDRKPFKQTIQANKYSIQCRNKDNEDELPPPFIYNQKKNTTCLDYKTRYCCKMSEMWRPVTIESIVNQLPATPPIGVTTASWTVPTDGYTNKKPKGAGASTMTVDFRVYDGQKHSKVKEILIEPTNANNLAVDPLATFVGYIKNGPQDSKQPIKGNFTEKKFPDGSIEIVYTVYVDADPTKDENKDAGPIATITIKTDPSSLVKRIVNTKIEDHRSGLKSDTSLNIKDIVENYDFKKYPFDEKKYKSKKEQALSQTTDWHYKATITDPQGGVKVIDMDTMGPPHDVKSDTPGTPAYSGSVMPSPKPSTDIWKKISDILQAYSINTLVESPPLATLFHECTWMDWINIDYPGMTNNNSEYELKHLAFKHAKGRFKQHVCGNQDDDVHYIDAVTVDTQTPWHELKMDSGKKYETYKLAPTFGYVCKDENGEHNFCKDMKVRYCCANKQTAAWGDWGPWGTCSKTCGGGEKIRKRDCEQLSIASGSSYNNQCFGQGGDKQMQKRYSEESTDCNINECPMDHQFEPWTPWTSCTVTCSKGHKYRKRSCKPARGGGKECPPYETNKDMYEMSATCTQADCETFSPGPWTPWSACSTTCGKGQRSKSRKCISNLSLQVAADENCHTDLNQMDACKTRDCPVDGSWTLWGHWSVCSQNCIEHPEIEPYGGKEGKKKPEKTKAFMHRDRHCANPRPAHHGKSCARDKSKEYLSETMAERERRPCYTENDKDIPPGAKPTPWCPQHCIYTLWSEWSACDKTCLSLDGHIETIPERVNLKKVISNYFEYKHINNPSRPLRRRMKCLMREERFGGACPEKLDNMHNAGTYNGTVIWQNEKCELCKEHCYDSKNPLFPDTDIRNFPALDYPGKDKACVGYCPISCKMDIIDPDPTCQEKLDEYLKEEVTVEKLQKAYKKTHEGIHDFHVDGLEGGCFPSQAIIYLMASEFEDETQEMMREYLGKVVDGKIPKEMGNCGANAELEKIKKHLVDNHSKAQMKDLWGLLEEDCKQLQELLWETYIKQPKAPIYDGLFGGEFCTNEEEMKKISSDPSRDKKKYTNHARVKTEKHGRCHVNICKMAWTTDMVKGGFVPECPYTKWTQWGPWGTCNLKCGREGIRISKRKCVSSCNEEKVHPNSECSPIRDEMRNKTWTDEVTEPCDPCPPSKEGMWSEWSNWAFENQPACNSGKEPLQNVRTRSRNCMHSDVKKCEPNKDGQTEGKEVETTYHDMPFCETGGYSKK